MFSRNNPEICITHLPHLFYCSDVNSDANTIYCVIPHSNFISICLFKIMLRLTRFNCFSNKKIVKKKKSLKKPNLSWSLDRLPIINIHLGWSECKTDKCKDPENLANKLKSSLDVSGKETKFYSRICISNLLAEQHGKDNNSKFGEGYFVYLLPVLLAQALYVFSPYIFSVFVTSIPHAWQKSSMNTLQ